MYTVQSHGSLIAVILSCVFVNSKCKNNINNVKKSDYNNACTVTVDNNMNIHQVG